MKRLFIVASLAIMAIGCQKTVVENETLTPIGFNTEVGKQTRAIVTDNTYLTAQPFTVYAYGHQGSASNKVMDGVTVTYYAATTGEGATPAKWAAADNAKYYWPNDATTTMNFYAYSPAALTGMTHNETDGFEINYTQTDPYVDFMVATPVTGATYADQNGAVTGTPASVPVEFHHQLTQVVFNLTANIDNVTVTPVSITLKTVGSAAPYEDGVWSAATATADYTVFSSQVAAASSSVAAGATALTTAPVAMIPQTLSGKFVVVYTIEGTGVATETVTKEIALSTNSVDEWTANMKVVYNLAVGLNEITFDPTVAAWDQEVTGGNFQL